jgi:hypothetical protein
MSETERPGGATQHATQHGMHLAESTWTRAGTAGWLDRSEEGACHAPQVCMSQHLTACVHGCRTHTPSAIGAYLAICRGWFAVSIRLVSTSLSLGLHHHQLHRREKVIFQVIQGRWQPLGAPPLGFLGLLLLCLLGLALLYMRGGQRRNTINSDSPVPAWVVVLACPQPTCQRSCLHTIPFPYAVQPEVATDRSMQRIRLCVPAPPCAAAAPPSLASPSPVSPFPPSPSPSFLPPPWLSFLPPPSPAAHAPVEHAVQLPPPLLSVNADNVDVDNETLPTFSSCVVCTYCISCCQSEQPRWLDSRNTYPACFKLSLCWQRAGSSNEEGLFWSHASLNKLLQI